MNRVVALTLAAFALAALAACGGGQSPPAAGTTSASTTEVVTDVGTAETGVAGSDTLVDDAAAAEITGLVEAWYADADPAVCDRMTDALLDYGWAAKGDKGREECRTSLEAADPVGDVRVGEPVITGTEAAVAVSYTLEGNEQRDGITLVEIDGSWWLDTVARTS